MADEIAAREAALRAWKAEVQRYVALPLASERLTRDSSFMQIARSVAAGGSCTSHKVGAVIVRDDAVLAIGRLGTPHGVTPCAEGGCPACASGQHIGLLCVCVHAEAQAMLTAARLGIALQGGTCYVTGKPCLECLKGLLHAGVERVVYGTVRPWHDEYWRAYDELVRAHGGMRLEQLVP